MEQQDKKLSMTALLTILFAVFTFSVMLNHEIWADEAQVWLLAKNLSVFGLFKHLVNEGHPSLIYLLVMPFAKLNFSIIIMQLICWLATVGGAFMILKYSPFNNFTKISIVSGAGFLYFFPIIARNYSLLPFLVTAAAYLYPKSKEKPILYALVLALIANTHVIMFAFTTVLACIFLYDNVIKEWKNEESRKKSVSAFILIAAGLLAVVLQLHGTAGNNVAIGFSFSHFFQTAQAVLVQFFVNMVDYHHSSAYVPSLPAIIGASALAILTVVSFITLLMTNLRAFFIAFFGILFQLIIYIVSYNSYIYPTRIACAYLILIFCFWITLVPGNCCKNDKHLITSKFMNILLALMFILTLFNGIRYTLLDLGYNYSNAKVTAEYIQKNVPQNARLITTNDPFSLGLYYYLPEKRLWSIMKRDYIKYVVWDSSLALAFMEKDWSRIVRGKFEDEYKTRPIYVVQPSFMDYSRYEIFPQKDFKLIYQSPASIADGEAFRIYKFIGR